MKFQKFYTGINRPILSSLSVGVPLIFFLFSFIQAKKTNYNKIWINLKYKRCLKNKLPCECELETKTYFTAILDTNSTSKFYGFAMLKYDEMEFDNWQLKRQSVNRYEVFESSKDVRHVLGTLFLNGDTLTLLEKKDKITFVNGNSEKYDEYQFGKENIKILNTAFKARGYNPLERILGRDSLDCFCNRWMGKINLISIQGTGQSWILKQHNDSTYIYTITNNPEKDEPVVTELYKKYKWKN